MFRPSRAKVFVIHEADIARRLFIAAAVLVALGVIVLLVGATIPSGS